MRRPALRALLALVALLAAAEARADERDAKKGAPAEAAKSDEASQRFKAGVGFYKDGEYAAALVEFKRAYELVPNYVVLYNLGQTARELKDHAAALAWFEQYLREGGAKIAPTRRKEVQAAVEDLRKKVGKIKVVTSVGGAEVLVDDVSAGVSPLAEPVVVNVGRHKLSATASGYAPAQRVVEVASMAETTVSLDLVKTEAPPPPPAPPREAPRSVLPTAAWVTLAATGATAVVTGVMGGLALSAHGSLKNELATYPGDGKAIAEAQSRTRTFSVTADVFGAVTLAGAAATAVLFALAPRADKTKPAATVGVSPAGVVLRGTF